MSNPPILFDIIKINLYDCCMGRIKNYNTTRNSSRNEFLNGFKNDGDKKYNKNIIKKYFIDESKITKWEKDFYQSIKGQSFNITDKQYQTIYSIYQKYTNGV
jgi:hypothetical protein